MTVNVPWSTLRPNPRDQRERAAAEFPGGGKAPPLDKDGEPEIAWDVTDFGKRMAFGGIVGGVTGITFGAMDGHRAIRDDSMGKFPTTALKTKEFTRLTALSGTIFTGFFCTYQGMKYGAKLARKEDDFWNVLIASAGSFAPMLVVPAMRSRYPYAAILIAMDTLNNHIL
ncbi:unnamed protein product [Ectocarpus sp. CCAP 1310/34]|nr:unnamed protein product [Ectocarpus sp. CCAP 1310/34]